MNRGDVIPVIFYFDGEFIAERRMAAVPRTGDKVGHGESLYTVHDVTWRLGANVRIDLA